jgi:predicted metal-dependent hydrolase
VRTVGAALHPAVLDDGTLRVTLPRWGSKREALAFVERSGAWIEKQLVKHESRPAVGASRRTALAARQRKCRRSAGAGRLQASP